MPSPSGDSTYRESSNEMLALAEVMRERRDHEDAIQRVFHRERCDEIHEATSHRANPRRTPRHYPMPPDPGYASQMRFVETRTSNESNEDGENGHTRSGEGGTRDVSSLPREGVVCHPLALSRRRSPHPLTPTLVGAEREREIETEREIKLHPPRTPPQWPQRA